MENNEKNNELLNIEQPEAVRWYEKQLSLDDARTFIKANITTAARSFIAIGFYLKCVRDRELFLEDRYQSVWEFAKAEYGISMSTASRYMTMNDRFSENGNSPNVKEEYKAFGKSQLQEMLALTDEQLEQVKPTDRVEDIRGMRKPKEIPYIELPGQHEIEEDFPDVFPDIFPEEEFEMPSTPSIQKQEFSVDISELVGDIPEEASETQQTDESVAISQQDTLPDMDYENRVLRVDESEIQLKELLASRAYTDEYEARTMISNAERIRNMTDRQMAEFLVKVMEGTISVTGVCIGDRCEADRCVDCVSDWLRTES